MVEITGSTVLIWGTVLAVVNYYLGVFVASAPLPKRIRSVGWAMVEDAAVYPVLLLFCATPPAVLQIFSAIGFGNVDALYEPLYAWLGVKGGMILQTGLFSILMNGFTRLALILLLLSLVGVLMAAAIRTIGLLFVFAFGPLPDIILKGLKMASVAIAGIFGVYVWYRTVQYLPFLTLIPVATFTLYALYFLAEFIKIYWASMLGLGALAFGLPLRIGRRFGAALIAISLVFYVGLPFMPYFVEPTAKISSAARSMEQVQSDLENVLGSLAVWSGPSRWPTTQDEPLNMTYELRAGRYINSSQEGYDIVDQMFSLATGADVKNASQIQPTLDPPEFIKRIEVPEGLADFTFYTIILPNVYLWAVLAMVAAGLARFMAGRGLLG